ncbi:uncharacterized protein PHALS_00707 [Plasmopara halstedii]|uniref:Uncharacterized protein n=1 Tax=Plasmopara halstedii TaxID=4781 RepID=A0A0P1ATH4_PLAHL|nr:uncharacterized protein PHALS_00707 [Plasmopara halstedii]CEG44338.1 hypothetical protein PHALS_00707 [Plasmopara halstedii]|eukprot:XP_024580707.1 hypothetical protein PHALS_00707 [Plasmopara halstedii]
MTFDEPLVDWTSRKLRRVNNWEATGSYLVHFEVNRTQPLEKPFSPKSSRV